MKNQLFFLFSSFALSHTRARVINANASTLSHSSSMSFTVLMHLILPYPRYGFNGVYGTVLVPRKARVARVRLSNGVVIDVYSIEALERLLKEFKEVKPIQPVKPVEHVETNKPAQDNIVGSSDFVSNNPWLSIISKRGSE